MLSGLTSRLLLNGKLVEAATIVDCGLIPGRFFKAENVSRVDGRSLFPLMPKNATTLMHVWLRQI